MSQTELAPIELSDWLRARGRHFITTAEVADLLEVKPEAVPSSLERAREAGRIVSVTKGAWAPVPPEYRNAGAPPPDWYVDELMAHLGHPYYVGLLSAAAIHGASHQAPMVFQIVTSTRLRDRRIGTWRVQFVHRSDAADRPTHEHVGRMARFQLSTPEGTVFDLVESPKLGAGLGNVATIVGDLLYDEQLDPDTLAEASRHYPVSLGQRVGFLIDFMANELLIEIDTDPLHAVLNGVRYRGLEPGRPSEGPRDERWHIIVNDVIEHDL